MDSRGAQNDRRRETIFQLFFIGQHGMQTPTLEAPRRGAPILRAPNLLLARRSRPARRGQLAKVGGGGGAREACKRQHE